MKKCSFPRFCVAHIGLTFEEVYEMHFGPQNWYDEPKVSEPLTETEVAWMRETMPALVNDLDESLYIPFDFTAESASSPV
ncbi:MAG: hypothetical protein HY231_13830 [Acidobacteria bacterium]|nr:hypothetical protein [Acidobacteriota bacterium]